jgi:hypothetical protein
MVSVVLYSCAHKVHAAHQMVSRLLSLVSMTVQLERACLENMTHTAATEQEAALVELQELAQALMKPQWHSEQSVLTGDRAAEAADLGLMPLSSEPHPAGQDADFVICPEASLVDRHTDRPGEAGLDVGPAPSYVAIGETSPSQLVPIATAGTRRSQRLASNKRCATGAAVSSRAASQSSRKRQSQKALGDAEIGSTIQNGGEKGGGVEVGGDVAAGPGLDTAECDWLLEQCGLMTDSFGSRGDADALCPLGLVDEVLGEHGLAAYSRARALRSAGSAGQDSRLLHDIRGIVRSAGTDIDPSAGGGGPGLPDNERGGYMRQSSKAACIGAGSVGERGQALESQLGVAQPEGDDMRPDMGLRCDEVDIDADTLALFADMDRIVQR